MTEEKMGRGRKGFGRGLDALVLVGLAAHAALASPGVLVVTSDYETGSIALLPPDAQRLQVNLLNVHADAVARFAQGRVYVLNRLGQDNVLVLDPAEPATPLRQFSVGNGANPQDIEIAGPHKAYVSRLGSPSVLVVDPASGAELGQIDLSAFADADSLPEVAEMALVGDRLYVACQRVDRDNNWVPVGDSYLAVVDTGTDQLVDVDGDAPGLQGIRLAATNPSTLVPVGQRLVAACSGVFGRADGGLVSVDLGTGAAALLVGEEALGGDVSGLAVVSADKGYVVVSDASYVNSVRPVALASGQVGAPLAGHSGGYTPSLASDGQRLYVADRGSFSNPDAAGLLIYDAASGALIAGPLSTGLPPASIAVLQEAPPITAVLQPDASLPRAAQLGPAYPNPFNGAVQIPFTAPTGGELVRLGVWDVLGRPVRTLVQGTVAAGQHLVSWDGRDAAGRHAGNGVYVVRLEVGGARATTRVLLLE